MTAIKTVTMNFLGTGQHREKNVHIITSFHQAIVDQNKDNPHFAARLFDGLGSTPRQENSPDPMPGTYLYNPKLDAKIPLPAGMNKTITHAVKKLSGVIVGEGMEDLLFEAILYLDAIITANNGVLPETINLQGFSRGADACLRLANVIYQLYPEINVNLFLIDQVPGPGRGDDLHSYSVPPNVVNFESTLMLHEYRPGFEPQHAGTYVFTAPDKVRPVVKTYYGAHGGSNVLSEKSAQNHAPVLLYDDLYKFCLATGSLSEEGVGRPRYIAKKGNKKEPIDGLGLLTPEKRFELLCGMRNNERLYAKGLKLNQREILFKRDDYVQDPELFINQEHRELFKDVCPQTFHWFFEKNYAGRATKEGVISELNQLAEDPRYDDFLSTFAAYFYFSSKDIAKTLPEPSGLNQEEKPLFRQPLVTDRLSYLRHVLRATVNYYHYHCVYKTFANELVEQILNKCINLSYKIEDLKAVDSLERAIEAMKLFLMNNNDKGFIWCQLVNISPNPARLTEQVMEVLGEHLKHNTLLNNAQREEIHQRMAVITLINEDKSKDSYQKYHEIRKEIISLHDRIVSLQDMDKRVQNIFHNSFHAFRKNKEALYNLTTLSKSLNSLSHAHLGTKEFCDFILPDLKSYHKRNQFWNGVKSVLNHCGISFPEVYSKEKGEIATSLTKSLVRLKEEGRGSDIHAIRKVLNETQKSLTAYYRKNDNLEQGALDKIINKSLKLSNEMSLTDVRPAEEVQSSPSSH